MAGSPNFRSVLNTSVKTLLKSNISSFAFVNGTEEELKRTFLPVTGVTLQKKTCSNSATLQKQKLFESKKMVFSQFSVPVELQHRALQCLLKIDY